MKEYKTRYEEILKYYQTWLMGFSKLAVRQGMCHQNIYYSHYLMIGCLNFPNKEPAHAVVPQCLHKIIFGQQVEKSSLPIDDQNVSLSTQEDLLVHHPMLEGVLLSECVRLKQRSLANKLISLFQQFSGTEIRLKLVWLCWYDLMLGNDLTDWIENLKFKSDAEVTQWMCDRQAENVALTNAMDEYVIFAYRTVVAP
ncbi:hypothetical protein ACQV2B_13350 [Pantoea allii]|uniref:hypothetical protein n=1 Tax=Pantoea allii TaxID=574096 RepID=UPI003D31BDCD